MPNFNNRVNTDSSLELSFPYINDHKSILYPTLNYRI